MSHTQNEASTFKAETKLFDRRQEFWKNYGQGRPAIPPSFYQRFYDHHASNGGSFGTVYDVGAGFGELSLELAKKFEHVIIGDPAPKSLSVAKQLVNSAAPDASQFSFRQERIEDCDMLDAGLDAIFFCNGIHWTDLDKAMAVMTRQLKPGGTLFVCLNGIPKYDPKIQPAWWRMVDECLEGVCERMPRADVERILCMQDNGYDSVPLSESDYRPGTIRLKLNMMGDPDAFVQAKNMTAHMERISRVGRNDVLQEDVDRDWFFEVDAAGLRATVGSYPFDPNPAMLERHLDELDGILQGGKCEGHWPVSIIMATRK